MAYSAGSIAFSGLPADYTVITLNDGQSGAFSEVKFGVSSGNGNSGYHFLSGTAVSGMTAAGNASDYLTMYKVGSTTSTDRGYFYLDFTRDSQNNASFKDMATGGSTPLIYEFGDAAGNVVNITLVNESSGFSVNVSGASYSRKDSAGNYSINTNNAGVDGDNIAEELKDILTAAYGASEIDLSTVTRDGNYLYVRSDAYTDGPMTFRIKRASGSWSTTTKAAAHVIKSKSTSTAVRIANVYTPDEVVYSIREVYTGASGTLTAAQFATYLKEMINYLPIGITATVSDGTVSLTNDVEGTAGNVTITTTDATNITLSGMSGGASSVGGSTKMKTRINNNQLQKLEKHDKVDAKAINITGSAAATGSLVPTAVFTVQQPGIESQKITAATMQDYFSNTDLVEATDDLAYKLIFASGSGDSQVLKVDDDTLTWNANDEVLTIAGSVKATVVSGSGDSTIHKATMNQLVASTADINGGSIDGATIGASSQSSVKATTLSGSSTLDVAGVSSFGAGNQLTISAAGALSGSSTLDIAGVSSFGAGNQLTISAAGLLSGSATATLANATLDQVTVGSADINGGAIDGATIGASSQSSVKATTISGSSTLDIAGVSSFGAGNQLTISAAGALSSSATATIVGLTIGGTGADINGQLDVQGATSLAASGLLTDIRGTLSVDQAATFDSSVTVTGDLIVNGTTTTVDSQNLQVEDPMILMGTGSSGEGSAADRGLIMAISGATNPVMFWDNSATEFAFARSETSGSTNTIDVDAYADLRVLDFYGRALSGSGDSTIHKITMNQLVASTADINGGSIDGATVGASSQSSVKATTLSGSSTLNVAGASTFGPADYASISAAGVISGSGDSTIHKITMNQLVASTADINGGSIDGATVGASSQSSVKATTLSGSSTLIVAGASTFGPADYASISAAGVISGSGDSTIHKITMNQLVASTADINGGSIDGTVIGAAVQAAGEFTTVSGSGNLDMGGEVQLDGVADATADIDADSFYFLDSDGLMKRDVMSDVLALAKGDGIQVSSAGLFSVPMVEHVYMSASSQHSWVTSSNQANVTSSAFTLGGNNYDTGMVTASFDVYLNGMLQTRSGSWDGLSSDSSAYDYIITGSGATVLFENGDEVSYQIDDDDVVVIKYLVK